MSIGDTVISSSGKRRINANGKRRRTTGAGCGSGCGCNTTPIECFDCPFGVSPLPSACGTLSVFLDLHLQASAYCSWTVPVTFPLVLNNSGVNYSWLSMFGSQSYTDTPTCRVLNINGTSGVCRTKIACRTTRINGADQRARWLLYVGLAFSRGTSVACGGTGGGSCGINAQCAGDFPQLCFAAPILSPGPCTGSFLCAPIGAWAGPYKGQVFSPGVMNLVPADSLFTGSSAQVTF